MNCPTCHGKRYTVTDRLMPCFACCPAFYEKAKKQRIAYSRDEEIGRLNAELLVAHAGRLKLKQSLARARQHLSELLRRAEVRGVDLSDDRRGRRKRP